MFWERKENTITSYCLHVMTKRRSEEGKPGSIELSRADADYMTLPHYLRNPHLLLMKRSNDGMTPSSAAQKEHLESIL